MSITYKNPSNYPSARTPQNRNQSNRNQNHTIPQPTSDIRNTSGYEHHIDAIFTQLQDELITIKMQLCRRATILNSQIGLYPFQQEKQFHLQQDIVELKKVLKGVKQLTQQLNISQYRDNQHRVNSMRRNEECFWDRTSARMSEVLLQTHSPDR